MALTFYASVSKGLKIKVRKFLGANPTFTEVTGEYGLRFFKIATLPILAILYTSKQLFRR